MGILSNLEPAPVFKYFEKICSIPHGSGNTEAISNFCVSFAKEHGLDFLQDKKNNVIIWKKGTKGYENSPSVIIQGHLDMVCEKEEGCNIDFEKDGLKLQLENGIISAKGTTLGGDDGIAIAYALAILESDDIPHPPIEAVFTADEEIGMFGVAALDCTPLKSRIMLNIDSEEEGYLLVSCAGGITVTAHLPVKRNKIKGIPVTVKVSGLKGGHSGIDINKGRANSNVIMGRTLYTLSKLFVFNILSINGGLKDNAIPRETTAELIFEESISISEVKEYLERLNKTYAYEYHVEDADIKLGLKESVSDNADTDGYNAFDDNTTSKIITALENFPNGIQSMSHDIEGLVQTSLNLGVLTTCENEVKYNYSVRSSVGTEKENIVDRIECLTQMLEGTMSYTSNYPAWEYNKDSPLRDLMVKVYEEKFGKKPVVQAVHAGVECGLFAGKLPGLDCVSYGPNLKNIHTTQEYMEAESVLRTWEYTLEILKRLK